MRRDDPPAPRRLLVLAGYWPSVDNPISGIFVAQQAEALQHAGWKVTVAVPVPLHLLGERAHEPLEERLRQSGLDILRLPVVRVPERLARWPGVIRLNSALVGVALRLQLRARRFDACIAHGVRYCGTSLPWLGRRRFGVCIVVLHGVDPLLKAIRAPSRYRRSIEAMAERIECAVLVGSALREHATHLGIPSPKIRTIGNGHAAADPAQVSDRQRPARSRRRILSVCNLVPSKGVDDVLRALGRVAAERPLLEWEYRVVGDGPFAGELQRLTNTLGLADRVRFLGRLPYEQTMEEMRATDVFCLPSWNEAFGIVYLEAMARMRPVIGCVGTGAQDFVVDGRHGVLVPPKNPAALSDALLRLLDDPELCARFGRNGYEHAAQNTWEANARAVGSLFDAGERAAA